MKTPDNPNREKVVFAFTPADQSPDGVPTLAFLMPQAAWDYMQDGLGHEFDLTNVGVPLQVIIGRTETYQTGVALLSQVNALTGTTPKDVSGADLHFGKKPSQ